MKIFQLIDLIIRLFKLNKRSKVVLLFLVPTFLLGQNQAFWLGKRQSAGGDPFFSNVSLLLHMDGANGSTTFTDNSINNFTVTPVGNAKISTTQSKFGGASGYFDGASGIDCVVNTAFEYGTGDYTVEFFIYMTSINPNGVIIYDHRTAATQNVPTIYIDGSNILTLFINGNFRILNAGTVPVNSWTHIALVRNAGTTRLYLNGNSTGSTTYSYNSQNLAPYFAYYKLANLYNLTGYMDEVRITKGVARYTSNFTPPTAPFPNN